MNLKSLTEFVIEKMKRELPKTVVYHSSDHTVDVHDAAVRLGKLEGLDEYEISLLRAAALFHDFGITMDFEDHERISAMYAREYLPSFGFNDNEIAIVEKMIMSTRLPQKAETLAEKVLCDADLDYLGRADFFVIAQKLRLEWELLGKKVELCDWYVLQMDFLKAHKYHTTSAIELRNKRKLQNLQEIENLCIKGCLRA